MGKKLGSGIFKLSLISLLTGIFCNCVTPIILNLDDERYKSEQPRITILPIYARTEQIYNLQKISPLLEDFKFDEHYLQYYNMENDYDKNHRIKQNIFLLVISTRY